MLKLLVPMDTYSGKYKYRTHSTLRPPFLLIRFSYKYGVGGLIIVISLVYTLPFLTVECARETAMAELSVTISCGCDEAHSGSVLQGEGS